METNWIRERVRQFREKKGYLQRDMAELLNMTQRNYARIERGEHKILDITLLSNICKVLHIELVELIMPDDYVLSNKNCFNQSQNNIESTHNEEVEFRKYITEHLDQMIRMQRVFELKNNAILEVLENKLANFSTEKS